MTNEELLPVVEAVLRDAIFQAEFTRMPKDLEYAQMVARKADGLKAALEGRPPIGLNLELRDGRVFVRFTLDELPFFRSQL
jgi:hypothetical protein